MVVSEGFSIPPLVYVVPLMASAAGVGALLVALRPPITQWTVAAMASWMGAGAVFHVLYQLDAFPARAEPLFNNPTVYVTTGVIAGLAWILSFVVGEFRSQASIDRQFGTMGFGVATMFAVFALVRAAQTAEPTFFWPVIGAVAAGVVAGLAWILLSLTFTDAARVTGAAGAVVVFAHSLDGVSTAVGVDALGAGERTPLSRAILEFAADLPTAEAIGSGWLFVVVKVTLALAIVVSFEPYVEERPETGRLLLAGVAAVGLGPGVHNLLLFAVMNAV